MMVWKKEKTEWYFGVITFIAGLFLSIFGIFGVEYHKLEELKTQTRYVADSQVTRLQYVINTLLLKTQTLEMLVVEGKGRVDGFDRIAEELCDNPAIRSLQLAPGGVVTQIYPLRGNEEGFVDLFADPNRAAEASAARDSKKLTLSGPFELYQGGLGVVARRPVYLDPDGSREAFWGFAIIVLDLPDALYPAHLDTFAKSGFQYKLYRIQPDTKAVQMIDESSARELQSPIELSFEVPNGSWYFSVTPEGGWIDRQEVALESLTAVILSALLGTVVSFVIRLRRQKREYYLLSVTDELTGLYNYSRFMERLKENYRDKRETLLFFMDLDGFKGINDTYGHNAGNQVLVEAARRISECFHREGEVFRNGGDEFCAVLSGRLPGDTGTKLCRELKVKFEEPFPAGEQKVRCGISIGFAQYPADCANMEELIKKADDRMYKMKETVKCSLLKGRD